MRRAYLIFLSVYSVVVYHRYTNANIDPLCEETQLNMLLPTSNPIVDKMKDAPSNRIMNSLISDGKYSSFSMNLLQKS